MHRTPPTHEPHSRPAPDGYSLAGTLTRSGYYLFGSLIATGFGWLVFSLWDQGAWVLSDDAQLLRTVLSGQFWTHDGNWSQGRFNPLYYLEFDAFVYLGDRPDIAFGWVAAKALLTAALLVPMLTTAMGTPLVGLARAPLDGLLVGGFFALFWLSPGIYQVFSVTIYPEQTLIPLLAVFGLSWLRFSSTNGTGWAALALFSATAGCYLKEPAFLATTVPAALDLLNRDPAAGRRRWLSLAVLASGGVFLALYYFLAFRTATQWYHEGRAGGHGFFDVALSIAAQHPLLVVAAGLLLLRLASLRRAATISPFDGLLAGALAYAGAFVVLRLDARYYVAPSYILLVPALLWYLRTGLASPQRHLRVGARLLLAGIALWCVPAPRAVLKESQQVRYARTHDWAFVDSLLPYRCWFMVPDPATEDSDFEPAVDEWRRVTLETFLDYRRHGSFTGSPELPVRREIEPTAAPRGERAMILTPERFGPWVAGQAPEFRHRMTYFGLVGYAFPALSPGNAISAAATEFFREGWSPYEPSVDARWMDRTTARLRTFVGTLAAPARLTVVSRAFLPAGPRKVEVSIGHRLAQTWRFDDPHAFVARSVVILPTDVRADFVDIDLIMDAAPTPQEAGQSANDTRRLGLLFRSMVLDADTGNASPTNAPH